MSVQYNFLVSVFANIAPGFILGVRQDTASVDLFDNLRQGTVPYVQYRSHTITLPDERKFRPLRVYVKGSGTVTGGTIVFTYDNDLTETYTATGAYNEAVAAVLLQQQCQGTKTVRECDITLTLSGTNLIINETLWDVVEIE